MKKFADHIRDARITATSLGEVATVLELGPVAYSPEWVQAYRAELAEEIARLCENLADGATPEDCAAVIRANYK